MSAKVFYTQAEMKKFRTKLRRLRKSTDSCIDDAIEEIGRIRNGYEANKGNWKPFGVHYKISSNISKIHNDLRTMKQSLENMEVLTEDLIAARKKK